MCKYYSIEILNKSGNHRFKSRIATDFNNRIVPTPRPSNGSLPSFPFWALAGKYRDPGYGTLELCLVSRHKAAIISDSCRLLLEGMNTTLPGILNPKIPTFLTNWPTFGLTHASLTHFEHNMFNFSGFNSIVSCEAKEPQSFIDVSHPLAYTKLHGQTVLGTDPD